MYFSTPNKNLDSNSDGKFAPFIVIKNIKLNKIIITNIPVFLDVRNLSIFSSFFV